MKLSHLGLLILMAIGAFHHQGAFAGARPNGLFFAGAANVSPNQVNDQGAAASLKKVSTTLMMGAEASWDAFSWLGLGLRLMRNQVGRDEEPSSSSTNYEVAIAQDILMATTRFTISQNKFSLVELFGGFGGAATRLKWKSSGQSGELKADGLDSPVSMAGLSLSLGYKNLFLVLEGGYMDNEVNDFVRSGTINDHIKIVNLSGTFATIGIRFDPTGISAGGSSGKK